MKALDPIYQERPLKTESNRSLFELMTNKHDSHQSEPAFNEFYHRFYRYLWNACSRICFRFSKNSSLAEDIFQITMAKAYGKAHQLIKKNDINELPDAKIKTWLGTIANNALLDYIKGNSFESKHVEFVIGIHDEPGESAPDGHSSESLVTDIQMAALEDAISKLSQKERDIIYAYRFRMSPKQESSILTELAKKYGISTDGVRKAYYRTIEKLKIQLNI